MPKDTFHKKKDETIFVIDCFGNIRTHAYAVASLGKVVFPLLGVIIDLLPLRALETPYSFIARNRYRLGYGKKQQSEQCRMIQPQEHSRIIL